jgi:hypothetical protein
VKRVIKLTSIEMRTTVNARLDLFWLPGYLGFGKVRILEFCRERYEVSPPL